MQFDDDAEDFDDYTYDEAEEIDGFALDGAE